MSDSERGDQIIKIYSPVAEDIDEALCNLDAEIAKLRAEVERLERKIEEFKTIGYRNLELAQGLQGQLKVAVAAVQAAIDWRGLDGDGISDPVRLQLYAAIPAQPAVVATSRCKGSIPNPEQVELSADEVRRHAQPAPDAAEPKNCGRCGGSGNFDDSDSTDDRVCPKCKGSGKPAPEKPASPAGGGK